MSNVLTVTLYVDDTRIEVNVETLGDGHFTLTLSVNGKRKIKPKGGFATPHEALDYALIHYTGHPLTGAYVEGGTDELDAGAADDFVRSLESKGMRAFRKYLAELDTQYGIVPANEAEYRTAHMRWANKGSLFDTAVATNRMRNSRKP